MSFGGKLSPGASCQSPEPPTNISVMKRYLRVRGKNELLGVPSFHLQWARRHTTHRGGGCCYVSAMLMFVFLSTTTTRTAATTTSTTVYGTLWKPRWSFNQTLPQWKSVLYCFLPYSWSGIIIFMGAQLIKKSRRNFAWRKKTKLKRWWSAKWKSYGPPCKTQYCNMR